MAIGEAATGLRLNEGEMPDVGAIAAHQSSAFAEYIDWRAEHPSDDLMTDLMRAEFEDVTGTRRTLTRDEVLGYVSLVAAAGNETTTRLIGWAGKVLADHPDQHREVAENLDLVPPTIEELLRLRPPSRCRPATSRPTSSTTARRFPRAA
jgi:cytochrome P450